MSDAEGQESEAAGASPLVYITDIQVTFQFAFKLQDKMLT